MATSRFRFEQSGPSDGTPLTFSHALGADRQMWQAQQAAFSGQYRVITYDIRGHGAGVDDLDGCDLDQLAQDVLSMWDELGIVRSHFVGLSLGGCIGAALALRSPQRLRSLVVVNARLEMDDAASAMWRQRSAAALAQGTLAAIAEPTLERWLTPGFASQNPDVVATLRRTLLASSAQGYAACAQALADVHLQSRLASFHSPALFIAGLDDQAVVPALTSLYAHSNPAFSYRELRGPHLLSIENPTEFNDVVARFLGTIDADNGG